MPCCLFVKADFEKFADYDTRFYGLFYTKTDNGIKVKIDIKRMKSTVGCTLSDKQIRHQSEHNAFQYFLCVLIVTHK